MARDAMVLFVTLVTGGFALARAIGETGYFPWFQEFIPNSVRGRYSAMNSVYITLAGLAAVGVSGYVLDIWDGLATYMWLIAVGLVFGFASVWAYTRVPGGAPSAAAARVKTLMLQMAEAGRDRNFVRYLAGAALITIGTVPVVSFIPLYMQEEVGLSAGSTVLLQAGTLIGVLITSLPWGWASDRYGSKPVMLLGLGLKILLPVAWFLMPHSYPANLYVALTIAAILGISDVGWAIGAGRLLFVSVVPPAQSMAYMSLHYAWIGVIGGTSQLLGGWILERTAGLVRGVVWDSGEPLYTAVCPGVHSDGRRAVSAAQYAGRQRFRRGPVCGDVLPGQPLPGHDLADPLLRCARGTARRLHHRANGAGQESPGGG